MACLTCPSSLPLSPVPCLTSSHPPGPRPGFTASGPPGLFQALWGSSSAPLLCVTGGLWAGLPTPLPLPRVPQHVPVQGQALKVMNKYPRRSSARRAGGPSGRVRVVLILQKEPPEGPGLKSPPHQFPVGWSLANLSAWLSRLSGGVVLMARVDKRLCVQGAQ